MKQYALLCSCVLPLVWLGCQERASEVDVSASKASQATSASAEGEEHSHAEGHEDCASDHSGSAQIEHTEVREVKNEDGKTAKHVGAELARAPEMSLEDLLTKGSELRGKTIRVSGNVAAMCLHKRNWFALVGDGPSRKYVRVLTTPSFLVPEGSVGSHAITEGTVDIVEVPRASLQHFAQMHKLAPTEAEGDGPIEQVVIRASGAQFM